MKYTFFFFHSKRYPLVLYQQEWKEYVTIYRVWIHVVEISDVHTILGDFMFAFMHSKFLMDRGLLRKKIICSDGGGGGKFFSFRLFFEGKQDFDKIAYPERIPIHIK